MPEDIGQNFPLAREPASLIRLGCVKPSVEYFRMVELLRNLKHPFSTARRSDLQGCYTCSFSAVVTRSDYKMKKRSPGSRSEVKIAFAMRFSGTVADSQHRFFESDRSTEFPLGALCRCSLPSAPMTAVRRGCVKTLRLNDLQEQNSTSRGQLSGAQDSVFFFAASPGNRSNKFQEEGVFTQPLREAVTG